MDSIFAWLGQYWWACLIGIGIVMKVLNKITVHFSEHKGLVRWCLFLIDILDICKSTPAPRQPRRSNSIKIGSTLLVLLLLPLAGCASTFSGKLAQAHSAIDGVTATALEVFHIECLRRAKACAARGIRKSLDCAPWRACDNARAGLVSAVRLVEDGLLAMDQAAKQAKAAGVLK